MRHSRHAFAAVATAAGMGAVMLVRSARERRNGVRPTHGAPPPAKKGKPASRQFQLKKKEAIPEGIVRIAEGRLDSALDQLSGRAGSDAATAVHETRKDLKKLRAVTRLAGADPRWDKRFRKTGRRLAGRRDAYVLLATLDGLIERGEVKRKDVRGLRKGLAADRRQQEAEAQPSELAYAELVVARSEIAGIAPGGNSFKALRPGLEAIYADGRAGYRTARRRPTPEHLHEWRKGVKGLWYSAAMLNPAWPKMMGQLASEAKELSELLGEDHDLALLADRAKGKKHKPLRKAIAKRRSRLRKRALKLGRRLYAEKPKGFSRRIGQAWKASHQPG